jgi:hypothetical protein
VTFRSITQYKINFLAVPFVYIAIASQEYEECWENIRPKSGYLLQKIGKSFWHICTINMMVHHGSWITHVFDAGKYGGKNSTLL